MLNVKEVMELLKDLQNPKSDAETKLIAFISHENFEEWATHHQREDTGMQVLLQLRNYATKSDSTLALVIRKKFRINDLHVCAAHGTWNVENTAELSSDVSKAFMSSDIFGLTPLYDALMNDRKEIQEFYRSHLLCKADSLVRFKALGTEQEGAGIREYEQTDHISLLHVVACIGDRDGIRKIKALGPVDLMTTNPDGHWPIHCAIYNNRVNCLEDLFDPKMNNIRDRNGQYLIHHIPIDSKSAVEILQILLKLGKNPNQLDTSGNTFLSNTFFTNLVGETNRCDTLALRLSRAESALSLGADIDLLSPYGSFIQVMTLDFQIGRVPNSEAFFIGYPPTGQYIIIPPDDLKALQYFLTPDGSKIQPEAREIIAKMMNLPEPSLSDGSLRPTSNTLLHSCVKAFDREKTNENSRTFYLTVMNFLLKQGIDTEALNDDGKTALEVANSLGHGGIVHLIQSSFNSRQGSIQDALNISVLAQGTNPKSDQPVSVVMQFLYEQRKKPPINAPGVSAGPGFGNRMNLI